MTHPTEDDTMATARQVLTPRQLQVWELHVNQGRSLRDTALTLGVDHTTIRGHIRAAARRIRKHEGNQ